MKYRERIGPLPSIFIGGGKSGLHRAGYQVTPGPVIIAG
jgi:hypothetical protein